MVHLTLIGKFEADVHPESAEAVIVRSADPRALMALQEQLLPDLEIDGDVAVIARDEWCHAIWALEARDSA